MTTERFNKICPDCFRTAFWFNLEEEKGYCQYHIKYGCQKRTYTQQKSWDKFNKQEKFLEVLGF